ncbi:MAG: hypothetical protein NW220_12080 [Leptolyngbyaceae cyanobacterium bins.349]|nr:hypothetical protein [Leptolyngbyaceae cyanobacterium bins.349]
MSQVLTRPFIVLKMVGLTPFLKEEITALIPAGAIAAFTLYSGLLKTQACSKLKLAQNSSLPAVRFDGISLSSALSPNSP